MTLILPNLEGFNYKYWMLEGDIDWRQEICVKQIHPPRKERSSQIKVLITVRAKLLMSNIYFWVINFKNMEQEKEDHLVLEIKENVSGHANSKEAAGLPLHYLAIKID